MAPIDAGTEALQRLVPRACRGEIQLGDRALRWVDAGSGRPTVILEAGASDTAISWAPILGPLAAQTHVVAYDRAGLGASDPGPAPPTADQQVADLAAVISQASDGSAVVVGHSWGGLLAQLLAFRHPELIAGLVLVDPAQEGMMDNLPRPVRWLARFAVQHVVQPLPSLLLALGLLAPVERRVALHRARRFIDDPLLRAMVAEAYVARRRSQSQLRAIRAEARGIAASLPLIRRARAASALPDVPVVVLSATRGSPRGVREHWTQLQAGVAAAAGRGRHIVVAGAGHAVHVDRPQAVTDAILAVVEDIRRGS